MKEKKYTSGKKNDTFYKVFEETELLAFLIQRMPEMSRTKIKTLLRDNQIWVNGSAVTQFNHILKPEQKVEIKWTKAYKTANYEGLSILFEDEYIVVINKKEGLLSMGTDKERENTAYSILKSHVKLQDESNKIFIVHRLDRETSGIMIFAKSERVQELLQESWGPTTKQRTYLAVVEGTPKEANGKIVSYLQENSVFFVFSSQNPRNGQKAITYYETLKSNKKYSLLKVNLETGRKNQIRVHTADIGHPIIGDDKYGSKINPINRLGLHAWVLAFIHPITEEEMYFETPIPNKFQKLF
jgi:23S rRNA pseudouridine1911/1915/1917 synthase